MWYHFSKKKDKTYYEFGIKGTQAYIFYHSHLAINQESSAHNLQSRKMACKIAALSIFGCFVVVTMAAEMRQATEKENFVTDEEAKKNLEMIEYYVNKTKMTPYDNFIISSGLNRIKRNAVPGSNEHWCCQEDPVFGKEYNTRTEGVYKPVTKIRRSQTKCGFGGWKRCVVDRTYTTLEVTYKSVIDTREFRQSEWTQGCPSLKVTCCRGFILNKPVNQCMTIDEIEALGRVLKQNGGEALCLMQILGGGTCQMNKK
ncbi:unnamed protein product [Owenia fusiformis]|uniref:Uncharacterized protein n=1 Tax=Owenia fusiformis TaxID=6347 RepID=A0A8J1UFE6_OWEFU|nr:unnamed protein product [Owenia fusiformis]